jgi:hypothetical protein
VLIGEFHLFSHVYTCSYIKSIGSIQLSFIWSRLIRISNRVLESIKAGKRLAESRFVVLSVAPKGQRSVASMFGGR